MNSLRPSHQRLPIVPASKVLSICHAASRQSTVMQRPICCWASKRKSHHHAQWLLEWSLRQNYFLERKEYVTSVN